MLARMNVPASSAVGLVAAMVRAAYVDEKEKYDSDSGDCLQEGVCEDDG